MTARPIATSAVLLIYAGLSIAGTPIDYKLWFSDTYVRTSGGWKYVFGQASLALPKTP